MVVHAVAAGKAPGGYRAGSRIGEGIECWCGGRPCIPRQRAHSLRVPQFDSKLGEWQSIYRQLKDAQELMSLALSTRDRELIDVCWKKVDALQAESDRLITELWAKSKEPPPATKDAPG